MNYLVTGGAGFIGSHLSKRLIKLKHNVTIIDNLSTGEKSNIPLKAEFIKCNLSSENCIKKLKNRKFDAILHFAGQSSGEISFENPISDLNSNIKSTLLLLDYAHKSKCKRFIFASSMSVYGDQSGKETYSEEDNLKPKSFYAVGKVASENYLKIYKEQYNIEFTVFRFFNVYGEGQNLKNLKQGMVSIYLEQFLNPKFKEVLIKGSKKRFRDLCYIDDVVKITINSINNSKYYNKIFNVGTGVKTTVEDIILKLQKNLSVNKPIIFTKSTPGDQFGIYANNRKIKKILNFKFHSFKDGLNKTVKWIKKNYKK